MVFFAFLYKILRLFDDEIIALGLGIQAILTTLLMLGINRLFRKYENQLPLFKQKSLTDMLQVYALICIIIALVSINDIPKNLLNLAGMD